MAGNDPLARRCTEVADLAQDALAWLAQPGNADLVGARARSITRLLRRSANRARKLARSARTNMSVSVFGPSQAGKSFLVSVLARPDGGRLVADFPAPDGRLDYISQINPEGEGESTGLVTRFTMTRTDAPAAFPIRLVLLSEADLLRTLINSFYMDGDQTETPLEAAALTQHIARFRDRTEAAARPGLAVDDVLDIGEYVDGNFGRIAHAAALRSFWEEASEIAPRLSPEDRAAFFAPLWGNHAAFGALYLRLAATLGRLHHAAEVFAPLSALVPRETSIIDVKTLHRLGEDPTGDMVRLCTPDGRETDVHRAEVTALAAELVVPMQILPSPIFAETDLLDFPGARNRFQRPLSETLGSGSGLSELLLRGKVAYLFDRYVADQEITSMLLCVPDSNMETLELPGLIDTWIGLTQGDRPGRRAESDCVLFFVMTKFDKLLGDSAAGGGDQTRFDRRMAASLLEKFGKGRDNWVDQWVPGRAFDNCYWLRNPNYFVEGLIRYDRDMREVEVNADRLSRLEELRLGCLGSDAVQRHFNDPARAWDAALALNDGGVGYLLDRLAPVCRPISKERQLVAQLDRVVGDMLAELRQFHVDDDLEKRVAQKQAAAHQVIDALERAFEAHRFGAVLNALSLDEDELCDRISRVPASVRIATAAQARRADLPGGVTAARGPGVLIRPDRGAVPAAAPMAATHGPATSNVRTLTLEEFQAETAIETWIDRMRRFAANDRLLQDCRFSGTTAMDLVNELVMAFGRHNIRQSVVARLAGISYGLSLDRQAASAALVAAEIVNDFVARLWAEHLDDGTRPLVDLGDGKPQPVFTRAPINDDPQALPETAADESAIYWTNWTFMFFATVTANATFSAAGTVNAAQNLALGRILSGLARNEAA